MINGLSMDEIKKIAQKKVDAADSELDDMIANDPELRHLQKNKKHDDLDNLDKNDSDDDLKKLELELNEGKDDDEIIIDDDDNVNTNSNNKQKEIVTNSNVKDIKTIPESDLVATSSNTKNKADINTNDNDKNVNSELNKCIYSIYSEKAFHKQEKYASMGVLEKEKEIVSRAIELYTSIKSESDIKFFSEKLSKLDIIILKIQNLVANEVMSLEQYKASINVQLIYEESILKYLENEFYKDEKNKSLLTEEQYNFSISRIKDRIEIIKSEINQEIPEDDEENVNENVIENTNETSTDIKDNKVIENKLTNESQTNADNKLDKDKDENKNINESNKQIVGNEYTLSNKNSLETKITNSSSELEPIKKITINEELANLIKSRIYQYKNAYYYFLLNEMSERQEEASKIAKILNDDLKKVQKGEEVNEFDLPLDITPDFINGCKFEERKTKFDFIKKNIEDKKNILVEELNSLIKKFQGLTKTEIEKNVRKIENFSKIK